MSTQLSKYSVLFWMSVLLVFSSCKTSFYQTAVSNKQMLEINNQIPEDTAISRYILPYKNQLEDKMNQVLGYAPEALIKNRNLPETQLSNFFADALLAIGQKVDPQVTFSMATKDGIRAGIKQGNVTVGSIFEVMPFENYITILELKGSDVKVLADFIAETNGQPLGNTKVVIKDKKIESFKIANQDIDPNKTYKLVTYDFIANGGDLVRGLNSPISRNTTSERVREALINYVQELTKEGKKVESKLDGRVKIIE
ncbi:5'-nucleotidase C-terminal domain-containing protein [Sphingobacterium sp. WM]|uniref:5'-nucleotidase C-terminal domain-containing protein n=1 Tax=Sphingobacterium sp. WM TaxID=3031802 RepID=UPI00240E3AEB|nr:5'-nucleotidase C-terminal domain-containing protein [Sphingobacterium sp. WM]WFB62411.1 5'-nucleotidase C-terminal domain-containing protein [Sphingobacterium sp. WM]